MPQKRSKKFLLDTNVFIAAFKSGWTKTTELLLELLTNKDYELVGNHVLLEEYRKWAQKLGSENPALKEDVHPKRQWGISPSSAQLNLDRSLTPLGSTTTHNLMR